MKEKRGIEAKEDAIEALKVKLGTMADSSSLQGQKINREIQTY